MALASSHQHHRPPRRRPPPPPPPPPRPPACCIEGSSAPEHGDYVANLSTRIMCWELLQLHLVRQSQCQSS
ncbi:unnamed protein product [Urochloa humidicola]